MDRTAAETLVRRLFEALGTPVEKLEMSSGARTVIAVSSPDRDLLIGEGGETLRALNHILRRLAEAKEATKDFAFTLDIDGFLESKLDEVRGQARMLAERVRLFKHEAELPPMSSYERLVIHELFADDTDIKTESAGEGKFRHVVLKYSPKQTV